MWKILEDYSPDYGRGEMGYRGGMGGDSFEEGFEEGCEHGYRKAMKEMRMMGMRDNTQSGSGYQGGTNRMNNRFMPPYPPYMNYRDDDDDFDEIDERRGRRRRDSRGRYM